MSAGGAWGEAALSVGCGSSKAMTVSQPGYEIPSMPTRPLLPFRFLTSQSIVSKASVPSSIAFACGPARGTDHHEDALGLVPAADILEGENIALFGQVLQIIVQGARSAGGDAIGRSQQH